MSILKHRAALPAIALLAFALGLVVGAIRDSSASQNAVPRERYQYRVLRERGVGERLQLSKQRGPFEPIDPPAGLEDFLNTLGRDGWEVEDLRIRAASSELKASRQGPAYYVYSHAGETGPRFLRLRRRVD